MGFRAITSLSTAFYLALLAGAIAGAAVARLRKSFNLDQDDHTLFGVFAGGIGAAAIFGAVVAFNAVLYFLTGPSSPGGVLAFTLFAIVLLALPFLLYESK